MKKLILFLFCVVLVLSGCSNTQIQNSVNNVEDEKEEIVYTSKIQNRNVPYAVKVEKHYCLPMPVRTMSALSASTLLTFHQCPSIVMMTLEILSKNPLDT